MFACTCSKQMRTGQVLHHDTPTQQRWESLQSTRLQLRRGVGERGERSSSVVHSQVANTRAVSDQSVRRQQQHKHVAPACVWAYCTCVRVAPRVAVKNVGSFFFLWPS